jgi:hypothetical protein
MVLYGGREKPIRFYRAGLAPLLWPCIQSKLSGGASGALQQRKQEAALHIDTAQRYAVRRNLRSDQNE